jgi:hypothetical protein
MNVDIINKVTYKRVKFSCLRDQVITMFHLLVGLFATKLLICKKKNCSIIDKELKVEILLILALGSSEVDLI